MRLYISLLLLIVFSTVSTAYLGLSIKGRLSVPIIGGGVRARVSDFIKTYKPEIALDLLNIYHRTNRFELVDPIRVPSDLTQEKIEDIYNCGKTQMRQSSRASYSKAQVWEDFVCGLRKRLPLRFLKPLPICIRWGIVLLI